MGTSKPGAMIFFTLALLGNVASALEVELHFWPTSVHVPDPEAGGALYMWPEFKVLLQTKEGNNYKPAVIDDAMAEYLAALFAPVVGSPIKQMHDETNASWGLAIPGGEQLRNENRELLPAMVEKFTACLGTLTDPELMQMKEVLYSPLLLLDPSGGVRLSDEKKRIAAVMFTNFQTNRCDSPTTLIPELLRQKTEQHLKALLTGKSDGVVGSSGSLLVLTTVFRDLLFSAKGLWVRAALAHMQDFITERLASLPVMTDETFLNHDYESFFDFVLLSRLSSGLSLNHYVSLAKVFDINGIVDAFKPFPLKQHISRGQVHVINLHLGTRTSTIFFEGAPL